MRLVALRRADAAPGVDAIVDPALGRVTIAWQLTNAVRAELSYGTEKRVVDATSGQLDVLISGDTTFTLTAYDEAGRTTNRAVSVKVAPPPDPASTPPSDPPKVGSTTGGGR